MLEKETGIDKYKILCCYKNIHGGGVACYVRNDLSSIYLYLWNWNPIIIVGIIYFPLSQSNFPEVLNSNINKTSSRENETYISSDFNINLNDFYIL